MKSVSIAMAAEFCGGRLINCDSPDTPLGQMIIDSRAVKPGDIFLAFKGERADGHDYIKKAHELGAACAIAERVPEGVTGCVILVPSVQHAIEDIAEKYRAMLNIPVIGITGSVGKTTAKEMTAAVLSQSMRILKTDANLNNHIGVPMTLSRIEKEHEAAVVEMGISGFGEMTKLARMARPTVALYTVIGHAHLEFLHDLDGVFRAKTEMLDFLPPDGTIIFNGDDEKLRQIDSDRRLISYGLGEDCTVRAENVELLPNGTSRCTILYADKKIEADIPAYGKHMIYAVLEGAAVGYALGLSPEQIQRGIASYQVVGRRGIVTDTGFITLIDDSYNANPDSMKSGIDSLSQLSGRRVCVLGDMLEMGSESEAMHLDIGSYARERGIELVLGCGRLGRLIAEGAGESGIGFDTCDELIAALPGLIKKGDTVLVKASRGMHLENAAEALKLMEDRT